jgi:tRNA modification GTPase
MDTICALSSGGLPAGVAVIRVSGPLASDIVTALAGPLPKPRVGEIRLIKDPRDGALIDVGFALWFPGPASFTGEDTAEFQVHGGKAVVAAILDAIVGGGARLARPGEFVRRSFQNGKLDLTQVEGLADLIAAETEAQQRQAIASVRGELSLRAEDWRGRLIGLRAQVEARLDFSDEPDVPSSLPEAFGAELSRLQGELAAALRSAESGERVREGFRVAILGRPNAGKSTLLNALARRDVAIVTEEPGTTRDALEVALDLRGYPVVLVDTAGLREAASAAEREGIRRALAAAEHADLVLWLSEGGDEAPPAGVSGAVWHVRTKADLGGSRDDAEFLISAVTGLGMAELAERLGCAAAESAEGEVALVTRRRQRELLQHAADCLDGVADRPEEIGADLLRSASEALGRLTGRIDVEDVLDRLFAEFCIGK